VLQSFGFLTPFAMGNCFPRPPLLPAPVKERKYLTCPREFIYRGGTVFCGSGSSLLEVFVEIVW